MASTDYTEPIWGKDVFDSIRGKPMSVMAANIRTLASIEGIMRAAMETDSAVVFEIAMSEVGYCKLRPKEFVETIKAEAKRLGFTNPYAIHGDHITIQNTTPEAFTKAKDLLEEEIAAGFTSFAIDASHNFDVNAPTTKEALRGNIDITTRLARIVRDKAPRASLEVEVGEIGHTDSSGKQELTTVGEAVTFVKALKENGIKPDLLAVHNGTEHGNAYDAQGNPVGQLGIDLKRTREIADAISGEGLVGITQHGTTGTAPDNLALFVGADIKKVNVATHFQNIVMDKIPPSLKQKVERWCLESDDETVAKERDKEAKKLGPNMDSSKRDQVLVGKLIKRANGQFKDELRNLDPKTRQAITEQTTADSTDFFRRFKSVGTATIVKQHIEGRRELREELLPPDSIKQQMQQTPPAKSSDSRVIRRL